MQKGGNPLRDHPVLEPRGRHHQKLPPHKFAAADIARGKEIIRGRNLTDSRSGKARRHGRPSFLSRTERL